jgi:PAS domain S-box-containing protein
MTRSIRTKITFLVAIPVVLAFALVLGYEFLEGNREYSEQSERHLQELVRHYAREIDGRLREAAEVAETTRDFLELLPDPPKETIYAQLRRNVENNPLVFGSAVAFAPAAFAGRERFAPYVFRGPNGIEEIDIGDEAYDYASGRWEWYSAPEATLGPLWTAPYSDEGTGNVWTSTYVAPFRNRGLFAGVVTVDIPLKALQDRIFGERDLIRDFMVLTAGGEYVFNADPRLIGKNAGQGAIPAGGKAVDGQTQQEGFSRILPPGGGSALWRFSAPIESAGWTLVAQIPEAKALAPVQRQTSRAAAGFGIALILIIAGIWIAANRIARRIELLDLAAQQITDGNLSVDLEVVGQDEIANLTRSFSLMAERLIARENDLKVLNWGLEKRMKERTQAFAEAEEHARLLLDSSSDGIFGVATDGSVTFINPAGAGMLGYRPEELTGERIHPLVHHSYPDGTEYPLEQSPMYRAYTKGIASKVDDEVLWRRDGTSFHVEYASQPIRKAGAITGAVVAFRDLTELRTLNRELTRARDAAEQANRAKSDFLASMSHEIRTPMNAIIGMTHLALKTQLSDRQRSYLDKAERAAHSLLGIVNDILDFSKIESGKLELESVPFRLEDVLDNITNLIGDKAQEKGLELLVDLAPDVPRGLVGDPLRLGQVLTTLANNAVKFTESGDIVVSVGLERQTSRRATLIFSVRDTGTGIPPDIRERLFQSFTQTKSSATNKYEGSGLGLALCKHLVEMMEGEIWVESSPGEGSTFRFTARLGIHDLAERMRSAPEELAGIHALVADDNASSRHIFKGQLESLGMRVDLASSGAEALAEVAVSSELDPVRLVLMNWGMPGMKGIDAATRLKERRDPPAVVVVTAQGREEVLREVRAANLDGLLIKPVSPAVLEDTLLEIFTSETTRGQPDAERGIADAGGRPAPVPGQDLTGGGQP